MHLAFLALWSHLFFAPQVINTGRHRTTGGGGGNTQLVTMVSTGTNRNDFDGCVGFKFTTGGSAMTMRDVSRWIVSGNSQSHLITVRASDGSTILGSATVNTMGQTPGQYSTPVSIGPISLAASTFYYIGSQEMNGGDHWYSDDTRLTTTAAATVVASALNFTGDCSTGNLTANTVATGASYVPPNFGYTIP